MSKRTYTAGENLFYGSACIFFLAAPIMVVAGIWSDVRWFAMAALSASLGLFCGWFAAKMK